MKKFIRENIDHQPIVDNVFKIVNLANDAIAKKGKENIVNATIGSLYDEDGNLVALDTVFNTYNSLDNRTKAKYASSFSGNPNFRKQVYNWVVQDTKLVYVIVLLATPEVQDRKFNDFKRVRRRSNFNYSSYCMG